MEKELTAGRAASLRVSGACIHLADLRARGDGRSIAGDAPGSGRGAGGTVSLSGSRRGLAGVASSDSLLIRPAFQDPIYRYYDICNNY